MLYAVARFTTVASVADFWYGPHSPNCTDGTGRHAEIGCDAGCLFDVVADPGEHVDLHEARAADFERLRKRYAELAAAAGIPPTPRPASGKEQGEEGPKQPLCAAMWTQWGGHFGPWQ